MWEKVAGRMDASVRTGVSVCESRMKHACARGEPINHEVVDGSETGIRCDTDSGPNRREQSHRRGWLWLSVRHYCQWSEQA